MNLTEKYDSTGLLNNNRWTVNFIYKKMEDPVVEKLYQSTEEGQKVTRNKGIKLVAVFRRIQDPYMITTERDSDTPKVNSSWLKTRCSVIPAERSWMPCFNSRHCVVLWTWFGTRFSPMVAYSAHLLCKAEIKHICYIGLKWSTSYPLCWLVSVRTFLLGRWADPNLYEISLILLKFRRKFFVFNNKLRDSHWSLKYFKGTGYFLQRIWYITVCNSRFAWFIKA